MPTQSPTDSASDSWLIALLVLIPVALVIACCCVYKKCKNGNVAEDETQTSTEYTEYTEYTENSEEHQLIDIDSSEEYEEDSEAIGTNTNSETQTESEYEEEEEEEFILSFRTKGDDIENYSNKLVKKLMRIHGFREKVLQKDIEIMNEKEGKVKIVIGHSGDDDLTDSPAVKAAINLLQNEKRVRGLFVQEADGANAPETSKFEDNEEKEEWQEVLKVEFKTTGEDMESYHAELLKDIMKIPGLKEKIYSKDIEIISNHKGKMKFVLEQSIETAMDDPAIKMLFELLENEERIKKIKVKKTEPEKFESFNEEEVEWQEIVRLKFETKGAVIQVYHQELLRKIKDIPGFCQKIHDSKVDIVSADSGKMKFMLKQAVDTAMDDPAIIAALDLLKSEERVCKLNLDESESVPVSKIRNAQSKPKTELTQAIMVSFTAKIENVKQYSDELTAKCKKIEYFKFKMYEKKITVVNDRKAKFQFIMFHSGDDVMEDPDLNEAMSILQAEEPVSKLKVETIPYFLDS